MTTLPQTTAIRLPRGNGNPQLAPSGGSGGPMLAGAAPAAGMSGGDFWRVIRSHIWLILGMLAVSAIAGYFVFRFLDRNFPHYTATGFIQVSPFTKELLVHQNDNTDAGVLAIEQKTQAALLRSDALLTKVLQNQSSEIRNTKWFKKFIKGGNPDIVALKDDFSDNYSVTPLPETRLVRVEFVNYDPHDCQTIVREMGEQHIIDERNKIFEEGQRESQQLNALRSTDNAEKVQNEGRLGQMRGQLSSGGSGVNNRVNNKELQIEELRRTQMKLDIEVKTAIQQRDYIKTLLNQGIDPPIVVQIIDANQLLLQDRAFARQAKLQVEAARDKWGEGHSIVKQSQKQYERAEQESKDYEAEVASKARALILDDREQAVVTGQKNLEQITAEIDQRTTDLGDIANSMVRFFELEAQQKGITDRLRQVDTQLEILTSQQQQRLSGKVQWSQTPEMPSNKSFPKLWIIMTIAICLGLALALGIAFIRELTDTTIRSSRDIERVGQMTILGMIGDETQDPQASGSRLPLLIFDAPHSMIAEQLRQVRTRLQHAASLDTTRSLLVTSPSPGDGKTTLACNLAAGLALNGRRILLVDGNFRRPEIHKIFALPNEQGFSDVLNGSITFDEVVQETSVPNLAVMTSGPKPINATEMFESQLLVDFIERALEEFDHVIFDSGPMMVVSESAAMAPRVDGVITVVRAQGNSRGLLQRMRDTLRAIKAEHLGVVLNGVRTHGGGYYARNIKTYYEYQNT